VSRPCGASPRPSVARGAWRRPPRRPTYHLRLPIPELRSGGGTTPHAPRGSAYWRVGRVACVKAPGLSADRVGSRRVSPPTTYHSRPVTSDFRLPTSAFPASHHARLESRPARFVVGDGVGVAEREADVVEAFH